MKLQKKELIGHAHTQPFSFRNWIFAHNGTLLIPKEVRAELGPLDHYIQGNNDSEVLFYWLMKHLHGSSKGRILPGIRRSLRAIDKIWAQCRRKHPLYKHPYHGLNWVLTNGKVLAAMCYVNRAGFGKAKALCSRGEPYYQLRYRHDASGWIVASEPLDQVTGWKTMKNGQILITDGDRGRLAWF